MFRTLVLLAALLAVPSFADAGVESLDAGVQSDAGVVAVAPILVPMASLTIDAGTVDVPIEVEASVSMVKTVFVAVKTGNWWLAAGAFLVLVVSLLRTAGKKFHDWLPDNNILDKPLIFLYDTKIGGWILNWLTALAGGIGTAMAAGVAVDFSLWKSVVMVSTSASMLFELYKDIVAWVKGLAAKKAAEKAAAATPPAPAPAPADPAAATTLPVEPPKP